MPHFHGDMSLNHEKRMIECDSCSKWYHQDCQNTSDELFNDDDSQFWLCFLL